MRAVSPAAANLQFERVMSETASQSVRLYSVPDIQPNPPTWSDGCNVPGDYSSGQQVCDARRVFVSWSNPLTYVDTTPLETAGNGGYHGECRDFTRSDRVVLGFPQRGRSCPSGYFLKNAVWVTFSCSTPIRAEGPNLSCGSMLAETITGDKCPIEPLPPITDPTVLLFESNPNRSDNSCLTPAMSTALSCLLTAATNAGGSPSVGSACRPAAYNRHLRDVWEKWYYELKDDRNPACAALRTEVGAHFNRHGLLLSQSPALNSKHITGEAVDVTIQRPAAQIDTLAAGCKLYRPLPVKDRVHFILR